MSNITYCEIKENTLIISIDDLHPANFGHEGSPIYELCIQTFEEVVFDLLGTEWSLDDLANSIESSVNASVQGDDLCEEVVKQYGVHKAMNYLIKVRAKQGLGIYDLKHMMVVLAYEIILGVMMDIDDEAWKQVINTASRYEEEHDHSPTLKFQF